MTMRTTRLLAVAALLAGAPACDDNESKSDEAKGKGATPTPAAGGDAGKGDASAAAKKDDGERKRPPASAGPEGEDAPKKSNTVGLFGQLEEARIETACNEALSLQQASEMYMVMKRGKCPASAEDLKAAGIIPSVRKDPWKTPYEIVCPSESSTIEIRSAGVDARFGTDDDLVVGPDDSACAP